MKFPRVLVLLIASAMLAGCAVAPDATRSSPSVQSAKLGAVSAHQRKFQRQTRNVVYFGFNLDTLDAEARARLNEQAAWILKNENLRFRVYGHTDKVGENRYNYDLGLRRANRVVDYLVSRGVSRQRLEAMVSNGENAPAVRTEDRERLNRRVVTEVYGIYVAKPSAGNGNTGAPTAGTGTPTTTSSVSSTSDEGSQPTSDSGKNPNSGRGNGDEAGDPGKSAGKNNGGDEV